MGNFSDLLDLNERRLLRNAVIQSSCSHPGEE
jgi:hypothetical protein